MAQPTTTAGDQERLGSRARLHKGWESSARYPGLDQFDSLQELLEQAGYKETRIFTPKGAAQQGPQARQTSSGGDDYSAETFDPKTTAAPQSRAQRVVPRSSDIRQNPDSKGMTQAEVQHAKDAALNSSWFAVPWQQPAKTRASREPTDVAASVAPSSLPSASADARAPALRKKQSMPAMSRKMSLPRLTSWASLWRAAPSETPEADHESTADVETAGQLPDLQPSMAISDVSGPNDAAPKQSMLRHAPSTQHLWQASMKHHRATTQRSLGKSRSFPAKLRSDESSSAKQQAVFDGAKVAAAVGMGKSDDVPDGLFLRQSRSRRVSLREAFESDAREKAKRSRAPEQVGGSSSSRHGHDDSICSISDVKRADDEHITPQDSPKVEKSTEVNSEPPQSQSSPKRSPFLFSSAASPITSRDDAVAMRNGACLDFARVSGPTSPPEQPQQAARAESGGIRKMRSVDALEYALSRMQAAKETSQSTSQRIEGIPESSSADSLAQEDFLNAKTTAVGLEGLEEGSLVCLQAPAAGAGDEIGRAPTPTLVITSPTGARPPQPLVLDGVEFEPRSVSPHANGSTTVYRPIAKRKGWKVSTFGVTPETEGESSERGRRQGGGSQPLRPRSVSRRRKAKIASEEPTKDAEGRLTNPSSKRASNSKSRESRRNAAATSPSASDASQIPLDGKDFRALVGKSTYSDDVRSLQKSVMQRGRCQPFASPRSVSLEDDDDPFNDFIAIAQKAEAPSNNFSHQEAISAAAYIDRRSTSPVPFQRPTLSPLGESKKLNNFSTAASTDGDAEKPLSKKVPAHPEPLRARKNITKKGSGIGLACLIDVDATRPAAASAMSQQPKTLSPRSSRRVLAQGNMRRQGGHEASESTASMSSKSSDEAHSFGLGAKAKCASPTALVHCTDSDSENRNPHLSDSPTVRAGQRLLKKRSSRTVTTARRL